MPMASKPARLNRAMVRREQGRRCTSPTLKGTWSNSRVRPRRDAASGAIDNSHSSQWRSEMDIERFMQGYKAAWEGRDKALFCQLFAKDGLYHNTPFAVQRGHEQLAAYWHRVELQEDVQLTYQVLASSPGAGIAHWHVTYQVASEELF